MGLQSADIVVLERLTLALDAPEQLVLGGDTDTLVSVLEQLTLALKTSGQKALGEGPEASMQEAEVVSTVFRACPVGLVLSAFKTRCVLLAEPSSVRGTSSKVNMTSTFAMNYIYLSC